jgi:glycosyltransferase involved in cell wall biosynthesis
VITGIFPPDIGGPASYVPAISGELAKSGHGVTVVTLSDSLEHDDEPYCFRVIRIRRSISKLWRFLITVANILREGRRAEVLYANGLYIEAVVANVFLRKPLVQKLVGDWAWERATNNRWVADSFEEFQRCRYGLKVEALKSLRRFCARRADVMIVPSYYLARAVAKWGVSEAKTIVIYNAVDLPPSSPYALPLTTPVNVITAGRLIALKQVGHLIESVAACRDIGLVIVGDGPERGRLESLVRVRQIADRVYFAGQRTRDETLALMAACDVFALNSTHEGFPHVVLEAMSVGLPVIATAVGGTPELVRDGENGILISSNHNDALTRTILYLVSSSEERRKLAAGAQQTTERFRHSVMIEKTEAVLAACAGSAA